jgi:hypothetical protein
MCRMRARILGSSAGRSNNINHRHSTSMAFRSHWSVALPYRLILHAPKDDDCVTLSNQIIPCIDDSDLLDPVPQ